MGFLEWLNRCLGKAPSAPNLEFDTLRADQKADLELVRLEERIVLNVDAGLGTGGDVLQVTLNAADDEATISVIDNGATIQVKGLPDSILEFNASQINSILVTGTDSSQAVHFLGQNDLILADSLDLNSFSGDVNIGIDIQVGINSAPEFNPGSTVTYLGQYENDPVSGHLTVVLQNVLNSSDSFWIEINGGNVEILDQNNSDALLYSAPLADLNSIQIQGADGESDLLSLDYTDPQLEQLAISFDGGVGGYDTLEFFGGSFDTITHNLTGSDAGSINFSGNAITEVTYSGLEPVFGGGTTANNVVINLPTLTSDALLENSVITGEMQIRSLGGDFELTTFAVPLTTLTITSSGGNSVVELNSFDTAFAPTDLILSGQSGDSYQLAGDDLLADSVSLTLSGGATLDLGTFNETVSGFTLEQGTVIATSGILTAQADLDLRSGSVNAQLNGTNLIKNGTGTVTLDALSSFSGQTTVNAGTLKVEDILAAAEVIVSADAILGGSGSINAPVTVNADGILAPGSSPGILGTGDLTLDADAELYFEINGTTAGTQYDQIQVNGTVDLTNATFTISSSFTAAAGDQFVLIDADAVTGTFNGYAEGQRFTFNGNQVYITYEGGDGNDVVLTVNTPPDAQDQDFTVYENTANSTTVGTIVASDSDLPSDSLTFTLTGGTGETAFALSAAGEITVADESQLDYESDTSFDLQVLVTDSSGATDTATITINLYPVNDHIPEIDDQTRTVDENAINGTNVGAVLIASDDDLPGDTLTFSEATGGTGSAAFDITSSGQIIVADQSLLNFETNPSYTLNVIVDDNQGSTATATVTINLNDLVEAMVIDAGDWSANDITIIRDGSLIRIQETGTSTDIVPAHEFDNVSSIIITGNGSDNTVRLDTSIDTIFPSGGISFDGAGGSNTLAGANQTTDWLINGTNSGSLLSGAVSFSNVENLTGNNAADTFVFQDGGQLDGTLSGGNNNDSIDFSALTSQVSVNLNNNSATGVNQLTGIEQITGDDTQDQISGIDAGTTFLIDGVNTGSVSGIDFAGFTQLIGSIGVDTFQFSGNGQITGSINGLGGNDVLDFSASTFSLDLTLGSTGTNNGFAGSESFSINSFDNINSITGSSNSDTLTGINAAANWSVNGTNSYSSTNSLSFSGFENLSGGTSVDTFSISGSQSANLAGNDGNDVFTFADGASLTGSIDGQAGADQIDFTALSSSVNVVLTAKGSVNGFQGTEAGISGGFDNINNIAAGGGTADKLTGRDAAATWSIQPSSIYGSENSLAFSAFETLQGGSDVDQFNINGSHTLDLLGGLGNDIFLLNNNGSTINGTIDGQGDSDHLNLINYTDDLTVTLTATSGINGFDGTESAKSIIFANIDELTGGMGTNTLIGIDSASSWTLNGTNTYQSTNSLIFSNFINLTGGSNRDTFNVTPISEAFNIAGGNPTSNPAGDELNVDTSAAGTALVSNNGDGSGSVTGTFPAISYNEIESFSITGEVEVQIEGSSLADEIEILVNGSDVEYFLGGILIGTSSLSDTTTVTVNAGDGDDSLTVDTGLAAEGINIVYDGQGEDSPNHGDVLNLQGTNTSIEYIFTDSSSGEVRIDGSSTAFISYNGLEPITSTVDVTNVILTYSDVAETITISDAGGGQTMVTSTAGETLTFTNPTGSLTINTGDGADEIDLDSLTTNFTASLIINGDEEADILDVNNSLVIDSGKNIEFNVETINVATGLSVTASSIAFNATTVNLDGDLVAATVSGDASTVNLPGSIGGADLQDAVDIAGSDGIINIAAGVYLTADTLTIDESVSLVGAGKDVVEIRKVGAPGGNSDEAIAISANNVSISGAKLGWEIHSAATDYQGYVVYTTADNTTLTDLYFSDNYRSAVVFEGADNLEVSDSIFDGKFGRAAIRDGDGGSGENFLITRNEFREDHFRWGPIAIGPQGTFSDPNNFAFSGVISFNYFGNGLEDGAFQEAGNQNYTLTITNRGMTADGIDIIHNTFDWQDTSTTNSNGIYAQPGGIYFDPSQSVPANTVNITNNIFNGFSYEGPQPTTDPLWNPTGGIFDGALEFDGVDDFGVFQSSNFDVGEAGTLSFWVNMDDQDVRNQFFEGPNNGGMEFQYRYDSLNGGQFFGSPNRNDGNGNTYIIQDGGADGTTGSWINLQYTWDFNSGTGSEMHLYINGTEVDYLSGTYDADLSQWTSTVNTIDGLMSVARDASGDRYFDGLMDDVGWFNEALNQTDLDTIRNSSVNALAADSRLVAYWDFNQASGDIAVDNINGIQMYLSTNGIMPLPYGPEFQPGAGQFGGALEFDGLDDLATFRDAAFDIGQKGTLNFWVKMDDTGRRNQFFEGPDNGGFEFQYRTNGGGQFYSRALDNDEYTIEDGGSAGVQGQWTNLQYTWDASVGEMRIYINGFEQTYPDTSNDETVDGFDLTHFTNTINGLMSVGRDPGDGRYFDGLMDDIGWFNDVLDSTELTNIRENGVASMTGDSQLVAHWNLDDAAGTTVVSGDSGTNITLYLQAEPPLPPIQGFGVIAPLNANVTYNAFNNNDLDSNVTLDSTNTFGDPLFAYENDPSYVATDSLETQFTIGFGSSAAYGSSEFAGDTDTDLPHIGAYQNQPTVYPGIYGSGDIVVYGTGEDDELVLTLTGEDTAMFVLTRDAGGPGETTLATVIVTDITSITFNGLGGDDVLIINQPDGEFFNPSGGIIFNGGSQNNDGNSVGTDGDTLVLGYVNPLNQLEADSVSYVFTPASNGLQGDDGIITINFSSLLPMSSTSDGTTTISFTGLEPVLDNLLATDRDFDFTDGTENIILTDDGSINDRTFIDSDLSESVLFLNPTNSLTIRTNSVGSSPGVDIVQVFSLENSFDASLSILAGDDDPVSIEETLNLNSGELYILSESVAIKADITAASVEIETSGSAGTTFTGSVANVSTTGTQLYHNNVTYNNNVTLSSSGTGLAGQIQFDSTVDGAVDLAIETAGATIFNGAVGGDEALTSLTTDEFGNTQIYGVEITTTGVQLYNDEVELGANTTLASSGDIIFEKSLNGEFSLEINTGGNTVFNDLAGTFDPLTSLTTDAGGTTYINGGAITTSGGQFFNDAVILGADAVLTSQFSGNIQFVSTLDGAYHLAVNTAGTTIFDDQVGTTTPLASLITNSAGMTEFNGGTVTTSGSQTYGDMVTLGDSTVFTSNTAGDVTFESSLTGGNLKSIDINSKDSVILNGSVSTDAAVTITANSGDVLMNAGSSLDAGSGSIDIDGANVTTRSLTTTNSSTTSVTIDANNGDVTIKDNGISSLGDVIVTATGGITMDSGSLVESQGGRIGISAGDSIALSAIATAGGRVDITSSNGEITDNDSTSADNVTASQLVLNAHSGIGVSDAIDTAVSSLEADASTGGGSDGLFINNTGNLTIGGIELLQVGLNAQQDIEIYNTGTLDVTETVQSDTGSVTLDASDTLTVSTGTTISTAATGAIILTSTRNIKLNSGSTLKTVNGGITVQANTAGMTTGNFIGVEADKAIIASSGTGSILITGIGGADALTGGHHGVYLHNGTTVSSSGAGTDVGTITITGTAGSGINDNQGVWIDGSATNVTSTDGDINITGSTTEGTGIILSDQAEIISKGITSDSAIITIDGSTESDDAGVSITSLVQSSAGQISITGVSTGGNSASEGTLIETSAGQVISTDGDIVINGTSDGDDGIEISDDAIVSSSATGSIELNGESTGTGSGINHAATIKTNTGTITLTAEDDILLGSSANILSNSGTVRLTADNSLADNGNPITMTDGSVINAGSGEIHLTANGNIFLSSLITTDLVQIKSEAAAISDNGDPDLDITAATAVLDAATGIGVGNPLETAIGTLSATVSDAGGILIDNNIAIELLDLTTANGAILINNTDTVTATSVVSQTDSDSNDITLNATGSSSDILVTTITATGAGDVILTADDGILDTNGLDLNRITADDLFMSSSSLGLTKDGINVDTEVNSVTADVNTSAGGIIINEVDAITLTRLTTLDGPITVTADGSIETLEVISTNTSNSDSDNGIELSAFGTDSHIRITTLTAQNSADIILTSGGDVLDSDSTDSNRTSGDLLTIDAGGNIGGISSIFTEAAYDPLQTGVNQLHLTSGELIVIENTGTSPDLLNLDASGAGTIFIRNTVSALVLPAGIIDAQDSVGLVSDVSITVPKELQTANLRLDAPDIINGGAGNIDINATNAILFRSGSPETIDITAQQFDGSATGNLADDNFIITNDSPALELIDLNGDGLSLTGGADTNILLSSLGNITVTDQVQTLGTGTLLLETTGVDADLFLNHNLTSETGSITIDTANAANGAITMADGTVIDAGTGTVSLFATDEITVSQIITLNNTDSAIFIETDASLIDAGDSTGEDLIANESGARVTINAALGAGKIGDSNGEIETQVDQLNIINQTSGEIRIIEADTLIVHDILQTTDGNIHIRTLNDGDVLLNGLIETSSGHIRVDAAGSIVDQNDGVPGELNLNASSVDLNAESGIGVGDMLEMSVETFSADTTGGDILLHNTATTPVTADSITTGNGDIEVEQTGSAHIDTLTLTEISAGGGAPSINISALDFGHILLGAISAADGSISLTSAGYINDVVDDQASPEVDINAASGSITLQAESGIGNTSPVEIAGGTLSVSTTTGDLNLLNVSSQETGAVTVTKLTTGAGSIDYENRGEQDTTFEEIYTTGSDITLLSDASLLFENPNALQDVVSTDGIGTIQVTTIGTNSSMEVNDGFSTAGGTIDLTAQKNLKFGDDGDLNSANGDITLLADSDSVGTDGGGITMSDGTIFDAGTGILDLQAGDSITVGQLMTTTFTRLTSTNGGIVDAGGTGGHDITADDLVIRSSTGAGSLDALETAVSMLAVENTDSGSIQIHNDLGGSLLTIGTVDGIAGITNSAGVTGDIIISNASPLTVDSPVTNSSGGNIDLESTGPGDLTLNASVRASGGNGNINVEAGDGILAINDTGVASDHSLTGTGVFSGHGDSGVIIDSNTTLNSETGAIAGLPPDLRNILTPQILATGQATVSGDFGRFSEQNFFITIDWGDGTVETFNFADPGSFVFEHTYVGNPNTQNPAADIPIIVTMQGDKQFTFSDGDGTLDFTSEDGLLETPGEGLATIAIDTTPQVPQLIFPQQDVVLDSTSNQQGVFNMRETQLIETALAEANKNAERLIFLRILAPNGDIIEDVPLKESDLDNLPQLFKTLPDGRYQIYLKEAGEERVRLLMDVDIRNGKASDVTEEQSNSPAVPAQQPTQQDDNLSQEQDESPGSVSHPASRHMSTLVSTDSATIDLSESLDLLQKTLINETVDWQTDLPLSRRAQESTEVRSAIQPANSSIRLETSEKAWSSAALLSSYFHGRTLFRQPASQKACETAWEKYGNRLLNRKYNLNRRQH